MQVSDEEKRIVAQAIELKRRVVRLRREVDRAWQATPGLSRARPRLDGKPVNLESLPLPMREKYQLYTQALEELRQLRSRLSPEVRSLVDPQLSC